MFCALFHLQNDEVIDRTDSLEHVSWRSPLSLKSEWDCQPSKLVETVNN